MKRLFCVSLVVLLVLLAAQSAFAGGGQRQNKTAAAITAAVLLGAGLIWMGLDANRTRTKTLRLLPNDGGDSVEAIWIAEGNATSGVASSTIGTVQLTGRWTQIDGGMDLSALLVTTPSGPITAVGLSQGEPPTGVAILDGDGLRMLCTWTGSFQAGLAICADSNGRRYIGNW